MLLGCSIEGCRAGGRLVRGMCLSHYHQAKKRGELNRHPRQARPTSEQRFLSLVRRSGPDECWLWTGGSYPSGYGQFWYEGRNHTAHRISYLLFVGAIEEGNVVCHRCDVRHCVNPKHLFIGTQAVNIDDKVSKDRQAKGVGHGNAVLTDATVRMIRQLHAAGHTQASIARTFRVSRSNVHQIVHRQAWPHVD